MRVLIIIVSVLGNIYFFLQEKPTPAVIPQQQSKKLTISYYEKYCMYVDKLEYAKKKDKQNLTDSLNKYYKLAYED